MAGRLPRPTGADRKIDLSAPSDWYWLVDGLNDHGYRTCLFNTTAVPQYAGLKHGNDHRASRAAAK